MMKRFFLQWFERMLAFACKQYVRRTKPLIVGITGSVGKSTCRSIISQVLEQSYPDLSLYTSPKNFNGELGLFLSVLQQESFEPKFTDVILVLWKAFRAMWLRQPEVDVYILEYGIDHPGEMGFLVDALPPDIVIVTAVDHVHEENFRGIDHIAQEKGGLVASAQELVFLNRDDERVWSMCDRTGLDVLSYSFVGNQDASVYFEDFSISVGDTIQSHFRVHAGSDTRDVCCTRWSKHDATYVALGIALGDVLEDRYDLQKYDVDCYSLSMMPSRASMLKGIEDAIIFDASYNASPVSMLALFQDAYTLCQEHFSDYIFVPVIGDMRELGDVSDEEHRALGHYLLSFDFPFVLLVGKEVLTTKQVLEDGGYAGFVKHFVSSRAAGLRLRDYVESQNQSYFLFMKGSQNTIFLEETVKCLLRNKEDADQLARQEDRWMRKKNSYFRSVDTSRL